MKINRNYPYNGTMWRKRKGRKRGPTFEGYGIQGLEIDREGHILILAAELVGAGEFGAKI